ncbi:MAG: type II toxin-antitoxin system RelE/ParE family toxin [Polyangiaceae bacterium]
MRYRFAERAFSDLRSIAAYTVREWGSEQCERYLAALETCCQQLAGDPHLGRACDQISPGLLRQEQGKHVVFYRLRPYGIRVIAILHERMLPQRHLAGADDEDDSD